MTKKPGDIEFFPPGQQVEHDPMITDTQAMIVDECDRIRQILLDKNRKYGDSAIHPARIFSRADPVEQINVRLDDKLSRIRSGQADDDEDVDLDLIGYLVLRRIARRVHARENDPVVVSILDFDAVEAMKKDFLKTNFQTPKG